MGFAKDHHKTARRRKRGRGPGLGKLLKILKFPFNIYTTAEASDFKFGTQLVFAKTHHKIKWVWPWARGAPENFGVSL